jgi:hypothetical protein
LLPNERLIERWLEIRRRLVSRYWAGIAILRVIVSEGVIVASLHIESVPFEVESQRRNKSREVG